MTRKKVIRTMPQWTDTLVVWFNDTKEHRTSRRKDVAERKWREITRTLAMDTIAIIVTSCCKLSITTLKSRIRCGWVVIDLILPSFHEHFLYRRDLCFDKDGPDFYVEHEILIFVIDGCVYLPFLDISGIRCDDGREKKRWWHLRHSR